MCGYVSFELSTNRRVYQVHFQIKCISSVFFFQCFHLAFFQVYNLVMISNVQNAETPCCSRLKQKDKSALYNRVASIYCTSVKTLSFANLCSHLCCSISVTQRSTPIVWCANFDKVCVELCGLELNQSDNMQHCLPKIINVLQLPSAEHFSTVKTIQIEQYNATMLMPD